MTRHVFIKTTSLFLTCLISSFCAAIDWAGEAQTSAQLAKLYKPENVIQLPSDEHPFLALYREARIPSAHGGVLLIHDIGGHADWPSVINPLRTELAETGWHTLSLQMPSPSTPLNQKELIKLITTGSKRVQAATKFFKDKGIYNIVLIAHRLGATIALDYLTERSQDKADIFAFVAIGTYDHPMLPQSNSIAFATKLDMPVLDIIGALDNQQNLDAAQQRKSAIKKADKKRFQQLILAGANEHFDGLQNTLARRITGWLRSQAPGAVVEKGKLPVDNKAQSRDN